MRLALLAKIMAGLVCTVMAVTTVVDPYYAFSARSQQTSTLAPRLRGAELGARNRFSLRTVLQYLSEKLDQRGRWERGTLDMAASRENSVLGTGTGVVYDATQSVDRVLWGLALLIQRFIVTPATSVVWMLMDIIDILVIFVFFEPLQFLLRPFRAEQGDTSVSVRSKLEAFFIDIVEQFENNSIILGGPLQQPQGPVSRLVRFIVRFAAAPFVELFRGPSERWQQGSDEIPAWQNQVIRWLRDRAQAFRAGWVNEGLHNDRWMEGTAAMAAAGRGSHDATKSPNQPNNAPWKIRGNPTRGVLSDSDDLANLLRSIRDQETVSAEGAAQILDMLGIEPSVPEGPDSKFFQQVEHPQVVIDILNALWERLPENPEADGHITVSRFKFIINKDKSFILWGITVQDAGSATPTLYFWTQTQEGRWLVNSMDMPDQSSDAAAVEALRLEEAA